MHPFKLRHVIFSSGPWGIKILKLIDFLLGTMLASSAAPKRHPRPLPSLPSTILIIRPGGMGDAVLLLPVLKALRATHPKLTVDILCEQRNAKIFETQPELVDHIFLYHSWRHMTRLFKQHHEIIIDTEQWHYLTAFLASILRSNATTGFSTRPLRAKLFDRTVPYDTNAYTLKNFFALFSTLINEDLTVVSIDHSFKVSDELRSWAKTTIPRTSIIISLGAYTPERRLTDEHVIRLIKHILSVNRCPVLLGGKDVAKSAARILHRTGLVHIINLVGKTSLEESAALIAQSALYIGPDSGLTHLACALGTKTIAIFGPGDPRQWAPRGKEHVSIFGQWPCSPCIHFGYSLPVCRGQYTCMKTIDMDAVLNEVQPCHA